jgi:hypothetical protein
LKKTKPPIAFRAIFPSEFLVSKILSFANVSPGKIYGKPKAPNGNQH